MVEKNLTSSVDKCIELLVQPLVLIDPATMPWSSFFVLREAGNSVMSGRSPLTQTSEKEISLILFSRMQALVDLGLGHVGGEHTPIGHPKDLDAREGDGACVVEDGDVGVKAGGEGLEVGRVVGDELRVCEVRGEGGGGSGGPLGEGGGGVCHLGSELPGNYRGERAKMRPLPKSAT
jgi:hypothetical protein